MFPKEIMQNPGRADVIGKKSSVPAVLPLLSRPRSKEVVILQYMFLDVKVGLLW